MSGIRETTVEVRVPALETDEEFLARLAAIARDWRFSDEFIGLVVRHRFPVGYNDLGRAGDGR